MKNYIKGIWSLLLLCSIAIGYVIPANVFPDSPLVDKIPLGFLIIIPLVQWLVILAILSKKQRQQPKVAITKWIVHELNGRLLISIMAFLIGFSALIRAIIIYAPKGAYLAAAFFLFGGITFLIEYFIINPARD